MPIGQNLGSARIFHINVSGRTSGTTTLVGGLATFNGDASSTAFTISHGVLDIPTRISVDPASADAQGSFYISASTTSITVNYTTARPSGSSNIAMYWMADTNTGQGQAVSGIYHTSGVFTVTQQFTGPAVFTGPVSVSGAIAGLNISGLVSGFGINPTSIQTPIVITTSGVVAPIISGNNISNTSGITTGAIIVSGAATINTITSTTNPSWTLNGVGSLSIRRNDAGDQEIDFGSNDPTGGGTLIDFHTSSVDDPYSFRILRNTNINGSVQIAQRGTGRMEFEVPGGYVFFVNNNIKIWVDEDGDISFFGVNPASQQPADPDTTGATLPQLEAEVNALKAVFRIFGFIAT